MKLKCPWMKLKKSVRKEKNSRKKKRKKMTKKRVKLMKMEKKRKNEITVNTVKKIHAIIMIVIDHRDLDITKNHVDPALDHEIGTEDPDHVIVQEDPDPAIVIEDPDRAIVIEDHDHVTIAITLTSDRPVMDVTTDQAIVIVHDHLALDRDHPETNSADHGRKLTRPNCWRSRKRTQ